MCSNIADGVVRFHNIMERWRVRETTEGAMEKIQLDSGLLLRSLGEDWVPATFLAEALESAPGSGGGAWEAGEEKLEEPVDNAAVAGDYAAYRTWLLHSSGLFGGGTNGSAASLGPVWAWKPVMNGKQISTEFNVKGKGVGVLMARQTELLIARPGLTASPAEFLEAFKVVVAACEA